MFKLPNLHYFYKAPTDSNYTYGGSYGVLEVSGTRADPSGRIVATGVQGGKDGDIDDIKHFLSTPGGIVHALDGRRFKLTKSLLSV